MSVFDAYLDAHGTRLQSEDLALRAGALFASYLEARKQEAAPVSYWTEARQTDCARWLHNQFGHSAGYIERLFTVVRAAFVDACKVKLRADALGGEVESALVSHAPDVIMYRARVAKELGIIAQRPRKPTLSLDQMAAVLDAIESEHLFRYAIMALATWARPQAIVDFDPWQQCDWNVPCIDLAPADWVPTNKRRPRQPMTQCLADWLLTWMSARDAEIAEAQVQGRAPPPRALCIYKRQRVASTKRAWPRIGALAGVQGFSAYSFRHFMAISAARCFAACRASNGPSGSAMSCAMAHAQPATTKARTRWRWPMSRLRQIASSNCSRSAASDSSLRLKCD